MAIQNGDWNRIDDHAYIGERFTYRADATPYDAVTDTEGGTLVLGNGMSVVVRSAFHTWNGAGGLDMLYVYVPATGLHTHVTPGDLGLPALREWPV